MVHSEQPDKRVVAPAAEWAAYLRAPPATPLRPH